MTEERKKDVPIAVRLPADLRTYVEVEARRNFRSVPKEIWMRVEQSRRLDLQGIAQVMEAKQ